MKDFDAFFEANRDKIISYAKANTSYNASGLATISKKDDWFFDDIWENDWDKATDMFMQALQDNAVI